MFRWGMYTNSVGNKEQMKDAGGFQIVLVVKNLPAHAGDIRHVDSIPGSERSLGGGHDKPL